MRWWILDQVSGTDFLFGEDFFVADVIAEVPTTEVVHEEVEVMFVLEGTFHVDKKLVVKDTKDLTLVYDWLDVILLNYSE